MNEKLSALMDGELDQEQARTVIKSLGSDAISREDWDLYHVIGESLRGDNAIQARPHSASTDSIFAALALEPTILAPAMIKQPREARTRIALAMAASVVTISAIGVVAMKQQGGQVAPVRLVQDIAPQPVTAEKFPAAALAGRVNDYLVVHRQFSNPGALQPAVMSGGARAVPVAEAVAK